MIFNDPTASKTSQIHEARDKMNGVMARVQKMVEEMDDVSVEALIEFGDPAESVLAKTKAIRPKFVVVGTRGTNSSWRGWVVACGLENGAVLTVFLWFRLVMGSTSHAILTQCVDTPVIISRGPKPGRRGSVAQKFTQQASPGLGIKVTLPPKE
jgi:nucleotide-binding universal stress UspA family protein